MAETPDTNTCIACSDAFALLAMTMQLPTRDLATGLHDGSFGRDVANIAAELDAGSSELDAALADLEEQARALPLDEFFHEARAEYTRLFSHPDEPAIRIYEALFLHVQAIDPADPLAARKSLPRMFVNDAALDAERCYKKAGLVRDPDVRIPADHMATELEFLSYLWQELAQASIQGDADAAARLQASLAEFDHLHVEKWHDAFFAHVAAEGRGVFSPLGAIGRIFTAALRARV